MASEKTTVLRTPTTSDPVLAEVVRRPVEAYRWRWLPCFGLAGFAHGEASFDFVPTMQQVIRARLRAVRAAEELQLVMHTPAASEQQ